MRGLSGEPPRAAAEEQRVRDAIGHRVEERAARARLAAAARDRAVEQVADPGDDHADDGPAVVPGRDQHRGDRGCDQTEHGQRIRTDADASQSVADGAEAPLDATAPAPVEHAVSSSSRELVDIGQPGGYPPCPILTPIPGAELRVLASASAWGEGTRGAPAPDDMPEAAFVDSPSRQSGFSSSRG